ncbi:hypothetical protein G6514_005423 [Epicoccum nigrum]|nr:hypothetical protein G6514_005423 [Epicoccum nigrum]
MEPKLRKKWKTIMRPKSQFEKYRRKIEQLEEDAARVENGIRAKLDLKRTHASSKDAHASGVVGAAVLGFTIITIIFTPLSFVTSLFAFSIDGLQKHQIDWFLPGPRNEESETNVTRAYTTSYIGKWAATAELASIALALAAMWFAVVYTVEEPLAQKLLGKFWEKLRIKRKSTADTLEKYPDDLELEPESSTVPAQPLPSTSQKRCQTVKKYYQWLVGLKNREDPLDLC